MIKLNLSSMSNHMASLAKENRLTIGILDQITKILHEKVVMVEHETRLEAHGVR